MTEHSQVLVHRVLSARDATAFEQLSQSAALHLLMTAILHEMHKRLAEIGCHAESGRANADSFSTEKLRALFDDVCESVETTIETIRELRGFVNGKPSAGEQSIGHYATL